MNHENVHCEFTGFDPDYEFHVKDLTQTEALKKYADHAVKEIKSTYGWDTDVQIHIEPEAKDKRLFSVSMCVFGMGEPILVQKTVNRSCVFCARCERPSCGKYTG